VSTGDQDEQRGVLRGMAIGAAITAVSIAAAIARPPEALIPGRLFANSIERALAWDVFVVACLLANIAVLARHRFSTPEDIGGGAQSGGTARARALQGALQNTLEQVVLAVFAHLAWAALMPREWQAVVPVAVALFVVGRLLFWRGYARGAPARSLGFALTFYPSVAMMLVLLWRVVVGPITQSALHAAA